MISKQEVAKKYIDHLQKGETDEIIRLFTTDAKVDSPLYGILNVSNFFSTLKNDTAESKLKTHGIFQKENSNEIALYFEYIWKLKNEATVKFDVVDIISFNKENKIVQLKIIYDTVKARPLLNM